MKFVKIATAKETEEVSSHSELLPQVEAEEEVYLEQNNNEVILESRDVEAVIFQTLPLPYLSLPLPPTKNEKTTVDNFF